MSTIRKGAVCVLMALASPGLALASPCDVTPPQRPSTNSLADQPITLQQALAEVRAASPAVRQMAFEARALAADADQAGRRLNPSIGYEIENFAGSGALNGFDQNESTLSIEQTFELGGKRGKRQRAAQANRMLGLAECEVILHDAMLKTSLTFYDLVAARDLADLAEDAAGLAQSLSETVGKRVDAGAAAPPELSRAKADAASLSAAAVSANARVETLMYDLASLWGSSSPQFDSPTAEFPIISGQVVNRSNTSDHPLTAFAQAAEDAREAKRISQLADGLPDLTVNAGFRRFEESNDNAFLLGFRIPLPIFDRNRDAARASAFRRDAARVNAVAIEARLRSQESAAQQRVIAATDRVRIFETDALPAARAAYDASVAGYAAGRFDLTTTLNARQGLIEAESATIEARRDMAAATTQLKSLIGLPPFQGEFQ
ncbi:MAG: TolC family protein [Litorimonas sp.]